MRKITILAPAKINLALDIKGRLENGYHDLDMIMQAVNLYERVTIEKAESISLAMPDSSLAATPENLAWKAAEAFFRCTGFAAGARITVEKHTPMQAGMAGGSADAAAVLFGLNQLYADELPKVLSHGQLCKLGASLGADVPFCLTGGTCRVQGIGEKIQALPPLCACSIVVVKPGYGVSTPAAFRAYDEAPCAGHPDVQGMERAVCAGDLAGVCARAGNVLGAVCDAPEHAAIESLLAKSGAMAALMTGSGSAEFGVFASQAAASRAAAACQNPDWQVYLLRPEQNGPTVESYLE